MKKKILLSLVVMVFSLSAVSYAATKVFKDVKPNAWYYEYVTKASDKGLVNGYPDGTFRPNDSVTRAQLAKIIIEYDKQLLDTIRESSADEQKIINSVADAIPSTVKVKSNDGDGSGFFVKSNVVMTNAHVVGSGSAVTIVASTGESLTGTVFAVDKGKDIALVRLNKNFKPVTFSTSLRVGQNAIAIGNPLGLDQTVTKGIVSKLDVTEFKTSNMFQMDASINSGNSGGAVINTSGQVIGMTTGKLVAPGIEGIAFAIRAIDLQKHLQENVK